MKDLRPQRRSEPRVERRKAQIEINLLADVETPGRLRRGCSIPFFGGVAAPARDRGAPDRNGLGPGAARAQPTPDRRPVVGSIPLFRFGRPLHTVGPRTEIHLGAAAGIESNSTAIKEKCECRVCTGIW